MVGNHVNKELFRGFESLPLHYGRLAQLGEHLPYKQGVTGSIPVASIGESQDRHAGIKGCRLSSVGRAPLL